jgi:hypothetical protein
LLLGVISQLQCVSHPVFVLFSTQWLYFSYFGELRNLFSHFRQNKNTHTH